MRSNSGEKVLASVRLRATRDFFREKVLVSCICNTWEKNIWHEVKKSPSPSRDRVSSEHCFGLSVP
jgi:hypothetical protein